MQRILRALCHSFLGLVILIPALAARAQEVQVEFVYPPVRFLSGDTGADDERIEPSGVEPIGDGSLLLIADDKRAGLVVVEAATGRAKHSLLMGISDKRPKWEELAHDDEGGYYVIGSRFFEEPSKDGADKKTIAVPRLLRFRLQSDGGRETSPVVDPESIIEWDITEALVAAGYRRDVRKNEVNIEGLAVRTLRDPVGRLTLRELVVGLREPHDSARAYAANITVFPAPNAKLALYPLFRFDAGLRAGIPSHVSSLDYLAAWRGFFVLTSTEDQDNRYHGNTLWFLSDDKIAAALPAALPRDTVNLDDLRFVEPQKVLVFGLDVKAEGLCVLSEEAGSSKSPVRRARLALVYDNDTAKTGEPGLLQFITLLRWPDYTP